MISATASIQPAIAYARRILFEPFDAKKWFVLGFSAFLAHLGGGGSYNYNGNPFNRGTRDGMDFSSVTAWVSAHLALVIALGILALLIILALSLLFIWLGSRGQFMFLDGVARNRAEIVEPWTRLRSAGNELFGLRVKLLLVGITLFIVCGGLGALIALPDIQARHFGTSAIVALLVGGGLLVLGLLALGLVGALLRDFVVPIMYHRGVGVSEAWAVLGQELLAGNALAFVRFYLMGILLWIAAAVIMVLGCCLTCCLALLPYLSSVVFLPIFVFFRCYSLEFLGQFGAAWRIIEVAQPEISTEATLGD